MSTGAKPITHAEHTDLWNIVENLAITEGIPAPKVYVIEDPAPNAFATGRDIAHGTIAVTTGLLAMMSKVELEGVIAHELSHIKNRDTLVMTLVVVLLGFVTLLSDFFIRSRLWGSGGGSDNKDNARTIMIVAGFALAILAPIVAQLIQLAISRKREFLADADGALLTRYPEGLASALTKIGAYATPMRTASNATAHLFISNPFGAGAAAGISKLFMTHPPIEERVKALLGKYPVFSITSTTSDMSEKSYDSAHDVNPGGTWIPPHQGPGDSIIPGHFANYPEPPPVYPHDGQWLCSFQEMQEWIAHLLGLHGVH
jgi:heat shock protein HtpX